MDYISASKIAEKWGVSSALVRKYCRDNRIPNARFRDGAWQIPEDAEKPEPLVDAKLVPALSPLAAKLMRQKKKKNFHGLYDYVQIYLTYSSGRMASSRLTRNQVAAIFKKGKVKESFEPMKVSDLIETMNHCVCIDYIIDHVSTPLTQRMIMKLHYMLMFGTVDQRRKRVTPGVYRGKSFALRNRSLPLAERIQPLLKELIHEYETKRKIGRTDILDFHVRFEKIFPFEDGNGRIGRLIMFKECLRHNVMPFVIDDKHRKQYLAGIKEWDTDHTTLLQLADEAQERFKAQIALQKLGEYRRFDYLFEPEEEIRYED